MKSVDQWLLCSVVIRPFMSSDHPQVGLQADQPVICKLMGIMHAQVDQTVLQTLEACAHQAIGSSWEEKLSWDLRSNLGRYRKYRSSSLRDLLRVIRNKHNHFREMPAHLQEEMALPIGFLQ